MQITKISPAVKTAGRYNIYVDHKYSFSLDELQLVQCGIAKGQEIDADKLEALKSDSAYGKNYIRAIDLISRRYRSEHEIRDYARRKSWTADNTERVIKRLYQHGYLDDARFAQLYSSSRYQSGRYSLKRIRLDLTKKGIRSDLINQVLAQYDDTTALNQLIAKKRAKYNDDQKLTAYLIRNGFRYDDVRRALDQLDTNWPDSEKGYL